MAESIAKALLHCWPTHTAQLTRCMAHLRNTCTADPLQSKVTNVWIVVWTYFKCFRICNKIYLLLAMEWDCLDESGETPYSSLMHGCFSGIAALLLLDFLFVGVLPFLWVMAPLLFCCCLVSTYPPTLQLWCALHLPLVSVLTENEASVQLRIIFYSSQVLARLV